MRDPRTLLSNPCISLSSDIQVLWREGAILYHIPPLKQYEEVVPEDQEDIHERKRRTEVVDIVEIPREIEEPGISTYDTPVSSVAMEITDRDISSMETSEIRRSPVSAVPVSELEDIAEERVPELEQIEMEPEYPLSNDIMDYLLVQVPPLNPGLPKPCFSLYLSSQLQYGVVPVYHHQCQLFLEEVQGAIDRLHRVHIKLTIDMLPEETRQTYMLPDALTLLNETEGAIDPFFGSMEYGQLSLSSLVQLVQQLEAPPVEPSPHLDGITASQELITMREEESLTIPESEFQGLEQPGTKPILVSAG